MFKFIDKILSNTSKVKTSIKGNTQEAHIALCVLLLEAAHIDGECSSEEMEHIISTLTTKCGVPRQEIKELIVAGRRERNDAVDLFQFTRFMNSTYTKDEKITVMEAVWRIIHIDDRLEKHEDHFAHKLANLLRLSHSELMGAKLRAKKQLA